MLILLPEMGGEGCSLIRIFYPLVLQREKDSTERKELLNTLPGPKRSDRVTFLGLAEQLA